MRLYVSALIAFLFLSGIAFGAVGDSGVSDGASSVQSGQAYATGPGSMPSATGYQVPQTGASASQPFQASYLSQLSQAAGYQQNKQSSNNQPYSSASQTYATAAPQTGGPYEEKMSADDLRLPQPQGESFQPDSNLNFVSATPPGSSVDAYGAVVGTSQSADAGQDAGSWYYPGSVTSRNKFWVQTFSGLKTAAGCSYGGYLPLWSDINAAGNFYVYEWYPGQWTPSVRWWGWTWQGYKKGWFTGDVPGWHILAYNCRDWSNYVYIYVWPTGNGGYSSGYTPGSGSNYNSGYTGYTAGASVAATSRAASASPSNLPSGAPTPPDPNAENLILPDFNLLAPLSGQSSSTAATSPSGFTGSPGTVPVAANPATTGYISQSPMSFPVQGTAAGYQASYPAGQAMKSVQPSQSCPGCQQFAFAETSAPGGIQAQKTCVGCAGQGSYGSTAVPMAYTQVTQAYQTISQTYQTVFPKSSTCRCNEYYVQAWPNKLSTVGSTRCGEWLPLWSKVSRPGIYWSFEWTLCGSPASYYCPPEVKNFGYKNAGWQQTWFRGNNPGWHILAYCSGDWSNYIYIYVWPSS